MFIPAVIYAHPRMLMLMMALMTVAAVAASLVLARHGAAAVHTGAIGRHPAVFYDG